MNFQNWLQNKSDSQIMPFLKKLKAVRIDTIEIQRNTNYGIWQILSILCQIIMV